MKLTVDFPWMSIPALLSLAGFAAVYYLDYRRDVQRVKEWAVKSGVTPIKCRGLPFHRPLFFQMANGGRVFRLTVLRPDGRTHRAWVQCGGGRLFSPHTSRSRSSIEAVWDSLPGDMVRGFPVILPTEKETH